MKHLIIGINKTGLVITFLATTALTYSQSYPDKTIKINTQLIQNPLESILRLEPRMFEYDTQNFKQLRLDKGAQYGFMADNMEEVFRVW